MDNKNKCTICCIMCGGRVTQGHSLIKDGRVHYPIDKDYYWADEKCERPRKKIGEWIN